MVIGIKESKTIISHISSCECKCKFDGGKCNLNQKWNHDKCRCECKIAKKQICEKYYIWSATTCSSENGIFLASNIDNLLIKPQKARGTGGPFKPSSVVFVKLCFLERG